MKHYNWAILSSALLLTLAACGPTPPTPSPVPPVFTPTPTDTPAPTPTPTIPPLVLQWAIGGGKDALSDVLTIRADHKVRLVRSVSFVWQAYLSEEEKSLLQTWLTRLAPFHYHKVENPNSPDRLEVSLYFEGHGDRAAEIVDQEEIAAWIADYYTRIVASGSLPPNPTATPLPPSIVWRRWINSHCNRCDFLQIDYDGTVHYGPCDQTPASTRLSAERLNQLRDWQRRYTTARDVFSSGPYHASTELLFTGWGDDHLFDPDELEPVSDWIANLYTELTGIEPRSCETPTPGPPYPP